MLVPPAHPRRVASLSAAGPATGGDRPERSRLTDLSGRLTGLPGPLTDLSGWLTDLSGPLAARDAGAT
ncbi:hypothetical protein GCM10018952_57140 [Streptosporangium vulgare]